MGRHVTPLGYHYPDSSQPVFVFHLHFWSRSRRDRMIVGLYIYVCSQCQSPPRLWVWIPLMERPWSVSVEKLWTQNTRIIMMYDVYWYCQMKKNEWLWKFWKKGGVVERCEFESRSWRGVLDTLCDSLSMTCDRSMFFPGTLVYSTNKTDSHDITEILLKVALNIINQTKPNLNVAYLAKTWQIPIK
jgi:hypothetical protein